MESFETKFMACIESEGYSENIVYNADETGIFWKSIPRKFLPFRRETAALVSKVSKERTTVMVCTNASG